jgi:hypothetical protein
MRITSASNLIEISQRTNIVVQVLDTYGTPFENKFLDVSVFSPYFHASYVDGHIELTAMRQGVGNVVA